MNYFVHFQSDYNRPTLYLHIPIRVWCKCINSVQSVIRESIFQFPKERYLLCSGQTYCINMGWPFIIWRLNNSQMFVCLYNFRIVFIHNKSNVIIKVHIIGYHHFSFYCIKQDKPDFGRLICTFVIRIWHKTRFRMTWPMYIIYRVKTCILSYHLYLVRLVLAGYSLRLTHPQLSFQLQ